MQKRRASEIRFQDKFRFQEAAQAAFLVNSTHTRTHTHSNSVSLSQACTCAESLYEDRWTPLEPRSASKWAEAEGNVSVSGLVRGLRVGALHQLRF